MSRPPTSVLLQSLIFSGVVLGLWCFPLAWYTRTDPSQGYFWLAEQKSIPGWQFQDTPISGAAEAALAANHIVNGEFVQPNGGGIIRVFSAKRYARGESEYDMFSHTPDRCWTSVGWQLEPSTPETVDIELHGLAMRFERRLFKIGPDRELVYFGALVGGQPLPYRLDQYQSIAVRRTAEEPSGLFGKALGAVDARLFSWPWESFLQRRPLAGPKQFVRISTPVHGKDIAAADNLIRASLSQWLRPVDYTRELETWRKTASAKP